MEAKAKILGHPIHQMLIPLPLGVLSVSLIFDLLGLALGWSRLHDAAYLMIAAA